MNAIRELLADVLAEKMVETEPNQHAAWPRCIRIAGHQADALLASPLVDIVKLAEQHVAECLDPTEWHALGPELLALLGWQEGKP